MCARTRARTHTRISHTRTRAHAHTRTHAHRHKQELNQVKRLRIAVATRVGGMAEIIGEGETGLFTERDPAPPRQRAHSAYHRPSSSAPTLALMRLSKLELRRPGGHHRHY
jgi:hypothetical protein